LAAVSRDKRSSVAFGDLMLNFFARKELAALRLVVFGDFAKLSTQFRPRGLPFVNAGPFSLGCFICFYCSV
jgi:hypothetical protein